MTKRKTEDSTAAMLIWLLAVIALMVSLMGCATFESMESLSARVSALDADARRCYEARYEAALKGSARSGRTVYWTVHRAMRTALYACEVEGSTR